MIRLVIVHPQRLFRECLSEAIGKYSDFEVVGHTSAAADAVATSARLKPDLVLIDAAEASSRELIRALVDEEDVGKVIACGISSDDEVILTCAEAGASGFLGRDCALEELGEQLGAAFRGELRCPHVSAALLRAASSRPAFMSPQNTRYPEMTDRENEIAGLIVQGMSNKEIAVDLGVCLSTVKHHVHSILQKLKIRRRGQIAACKNL